MLQFKCNSMPSLSVHKAGYSTFLRAFAAVKGEFGLKGLKLKLSTGKGNLERCDICTNADELLKISLSNAWSKEERDIIIYYRSKHLIQQWRERDKLASSILAARDLEHGSPVQAVLYFDGMTCITGEIFDVILLRLYYYVFTRKYTLLRHRKFKELSNGHQDHRSTGGLWAN